MTLHFVGMSGIPGSPSTIDGKLHDLLKSSIADLWSNPWLFTSHGPGCFGFTSRWNPHDSWIYLFWSFPLYRLFFSILSISNVSRLHLPCCISLVPFFLNCSLPYFQDNTCLLAFDSSVLTKLQSFASVIILLVFHVHFLFLNKGNFFRYSSLSFFLNRCSPHFRGKIMSFQHWNAAIWNAISLQRCWCCKIIFQNALLKSSKKSNSKNENVQLCEENVFVCDCLPWKAINPSLAAKQMCCFWRRGLRCFPEKKGKSVQNLDSIIFSWVIFQFSEVEPHFKEWDKSWIEKHTK